ncbi:glycosyltransferase [Vibrio ishigakensis]|uniref:Glycosyltransferase n=1 Tax=Vibrio ishigakensis TaxID=1481914 RepID=A0A0B8PB44_9VIBR|nr:glycosyltransferase [Vibrio ishigakensis]
MLDTVVYLFGEMAIALKNNSELLIVLFPMIVISELPLILTMLIGIFRWYRKNQSRDATHTPPISFVITCYGEGDAIAITIDTLVEQVYAGPIEVLAVVDGATQNAHTYKAAVDAVNKHKAGLIEPLG